MSTAQDSPKRKKQKARRSKQLAEWRVKKAAGSAGGGVRGGGKKKKAAAAKKVAKK